MTTQLLRATAFLVFASQFSLFAQAVPTEPTEETKVTVAKHGWSEKGLLVLAVKVHAGSKMVALGSFGSAASGQPAVEAFSMAGSTLTDAYTGQTFAALGSLPRKPFYGTMSAAIQLSSGESMTFGVAFPHPPDPPLDERGNQQPYKFKLQLPQDMSVEFTFPFEKGTTPSK